MATRTTSTTSSSVTPTTTFALTTVFTPPSTCFQPTYIIDPFGIDSLSTYSSKGDDGVYTPYYTLEPGRTTSCYPFGFDQVQRSSYTRIAGSEVESYYSPGVCPSGYVTLQFAYLSATTFATCCPELMSAANSYSCYGNNITADVVEGTQTRSLSILTVQASQIVVAWQSKDLSLWSTSSPSAATTPGMPPDSSPTNEKAGLSTGAKAGIGVGAAVGAIVLLVLAAFLYRRRRKRTTNEEATPDFNVSKESGTAELSGKSQMRNETYHEADASGRLPEMDSVPARAELEGSRRG